MDIVTVAGGPLSREDVVAVARAGARVALAEAARSRIRESRARVERLLEAPGEPEFGITTGERIGRTRIEVESIEPGGRVAYGVTTGFGELARVRIAREDLRELQRNLILSHACGTGPPAPREVVRAMLLLRANALAVGLSGVRETVVARILDLLNHDVTPVVPSRGSLGASGDLVPLSHAALILIGEGSAEVGGRALPGRDALAAVGLEPLVLEAKEGLALINGTQYMAALLALAVHDGWNLVRTAEVVGAMSAEALLASVKPFDERLARARAHPGHRASAENLRRLTAGSRIVESHAGCARVQDAYSLRCMPQVFGAVRQALAHADEVLHTEFAAATDNPLIFEDGEVVSGGNFHGEPLALLAAYLQAALAEVGAIAERRVARLVDPRLSEGLPPFLTRASGLNSGLMIPQYVAAALVLENQVRAHPAAVGNLPTSANQEDFNSNGAVGALLVREIIEASETIVGIEALAAAQGIDLRAPLTPGVGTGAARSALRREVPGLDGDRVLAPDIAAAARLVHAGTLRRAAQEAIGPLA